MKLWQAVQDIFDGRASGRRKVRTHDFAFSGLIRCAHKGGSLVGEIKKGKYIYYRAMGAKGIAYVREEELEHQFGQALDRLHFDEEVLAWVCQALKESHADKRQFHDESLARLRGQYDRLEGRISAIYVDKLDGKITEMFFDKKACVWRAEQKALLAQMETLQSAGQSYIEEGATLLELAQNARFLFAKQCAKEKRRLLNFLVSNCLWKDGVLTVEFKQPFDMLEKAVAEGNAIKAENGQNIAHFEKWLRAGFELRR